VFVLSPGVWLPRNGAEARLLASRSGVQRQPKRAPIGAASAAGSRSSCQSEAADLHSGVQTTHLTRSEVAATTRGGLGAFSAAKSVLVSADLTGGERRAQGILEALTHRNGGPKSKRNPMEEESPETSPSKRSLDGRFCVRRTSSCDSKKSGCAVGHPIPEQDPEEKS